MSTQNVLFAASYSQTLTASLLPLAGNSVLFTTSSVSEAPTASGLYLAVFNEVTPISGNVRLIAFNGSNGVCHYLVKFTGTDGETLSAVEFTDETTTNAISSDVAAILVDTNTTIPAQISALNNVAATDIVSAGPITTLSGAVVNVDLVDVTTLADVCSVNSDMRGTDSAATVASLPTVWDAPTASHQTAGSTGKALTDGGGSSASVVVYPIQSVSPQRTNETTLKAYLNETVSFTVLPVDADGVAVDTTGMTLAIVIEDRTTADVETITDASITKTATSYTFSTVTSNTTLGQKRWSCRNTANANVISTGSYVVSYAPE